MFKVCLTILRHYAFRANPFHATGLFLYPLKSSENQRFSYVFMGYRKTSGMKWVNPRHLEKLGVDTNKEFNSALNHSTPGVP